MAFASFWTVNVFSNQKEQSDMMDVFASAGMKQKGIGRRIVSPERDSGKKCHHKVFSLLSGNIAFAYAITLQTPQKLEWHTKQYFYITKLFFRIFLLHSRSHNFYHQCWNVFLRENHYKTSAGFNRMSNWKSSRNNKTLVLGLLLKMCWENFNNFKFSLNLKQKLRLNCLSYL